MGGMMPDETDKRRNGFLAAVAVLAADDFITEEQKRRLIELIEDRYPEEADKP